MTPPRILVIDDQYATQAFMRGNLRFKHGLVEIETVTPDHDLEELVQSEGAIAGAVYSSGQVRRGAAVENSIEEVLRVVRSGWPSPAGWRWSLILLDGRFDSTPARDDDHVFGLKILEELVRQWPDSESPPGNSELPIVMLSTIPRHEREKLANQAGALAYVDKEELNRERLEELLGEHGLIGDTKGEPSQRLIGRSHALLKVLREARRVAWMGSGNALILGPQGAGKSSLARYIHKLSKRSGGPLVQYFSAPSAKALEYANLFGYWSGAHSEARESAGGKAEEAHNGTLLIDEVHNLATDTQQELLQFGRLNSDGQRTLRRLGNFPHSPDRVSQAKKSVRGERDPQTSNIAVDVLLLSATNEPVDDPAWRAAYGFSDPLYTRLAVEYTGKPLRYPSLAQRKEDIPLLFRRFLERETRQIGGRTNETGTKSVDNEVEDRLKEYAWPGNVAELQGVALTAARNAKDFSDVLVRHLPTLQSSDRHRPAASAHAPEPPPPTQSTHSLDDAEHVLRNVRVPRSMEELEGRLASLQRAFGPLVRELLEVTMEQHKLARKSDDYITPALRTLFPDSIKTASQAYSKLLLLSKLFMNDPPAEGSLLAGAIRRARANRNPKGRKADEGGSDL